MNTLIVVRHAKASRGEYAADDHARPLIARGKQDAVCMGHLLKRRGVMPDCLISSTAARARETAEIFADILRFDAGRIIFEPLLYNAGVPVIRRILNGMNNACVSLLLVGHNPGLRDYLDEVSTQEIGHFPTAGICVLEFSGQQAREDVPGQGSISFLAVPNHGEGRSGVSVVLGQDVDNGCATL